jgi:hypothetical protein
MQRHHYLWAIVLLFGTAATAGAQDRISFAGKWVGEWKNSLGEKGKDSLEVEEDADGKLSGLWTGDIKVTGKRINKNTIELQGKTKNTSYQITATIKGNVLTLKYLAARLNEEGAYDGEAQLKRKE